MPKPTLSLCMIVKNEQDFIKQALTSVTDIVDEIIIVDTGSTDHTLSIAREFTPHVFTHPWKEDFSEARNYSLSKASKDWILILDGDETIDQRDAQKILNLITTTDPQAGGFQFIQRNYTNNPLERRFKTSLHDTYSQSKSFSGWTENRICRLFKNHQGFQFQGNIHELIEPSIQHHGRTIIKTRTPIHHFKALKPHTDEKIAAYFTMLKAKVARHPTDGKAYYELGKAYYGRMDFKNAQHHLEQALAQGFTHSDVYTKLIITTYKLGQPHKTLESFKKALHKNPHNPDAYLSMGIVFKERGLRPQARTCFRNAFRLNPHHPLILYLLAEDYAFQHDTQKALALLHHALAIHPSFKEAQALKDHLTHMS